MNTDRKLIAVAKGFWINPERIVSASFVEGQDRVIIQLEMAQGIQIHGTSILVDGAFVNNILPLLDPSGIPE
jgi:hypothetical protein